MKDYDESELSEWMLAIIKCLREHPKGLRYKEIEYETGSKIPKTLSNNLKKLVQLGIVHKVEELRNGKKVGIYRLTRAIPLKDLFHNEAYLSITKEYISNNLASLNLYEDHSLQRMNAFTKFLNEMLELLSKRFIAILLLSIETPSEEVARFRLKHLRNIALDNMENVILNASFNSKPMSQNLLKEIFNVRFSPWISASTINCPCCGYSTLEARDDSQKCYICGWVTRGKYDSLTEEIYCGEPLSNYTLVEARFLFNKYLTMLYPEDMGFAETQAENIIIAKKKIIDQFKRLQSIKSLDEIHEIVKTIIVNKKNLGIV